MMRENRKKLPTVANCCRTPIACAYMAIQLNLNNRSQTYRASISSVDSLQGMLDIYARDFHKMWSWNLSFKFEGDFFSIGFRLSTNCYTLHLQELQITKTGVVRFTIHKQLMYFPTFVQAYILARA